MTATKVPTGKLDERYIRLRCLEIVKDRSLTIGAVFDMEKLIEQAAKLEKWVSNGAPGPTKQRV